MKCPRIQVYFFVKLGGWQVCWVHYYFKQNRTQGMDPCQVQRHLWDSPSHSYHLWSKVWFQLMSCYVLLSFWDFVLHQQNCCSESNDNSKDQTCTNRWSIRHAGLSRQTSITFIWLGKVTYQRVGQDFLLKLRLNSTISTQSRKQTGHLVFLLHPSHQKHTNFSQLHLSCDLREVGVQNR